MYAVLNSQNVVQSIVSDSGTGDIPVDYTVSPELTGDYPSDVNIYFHGTSMKGYKYDSGNIVPRTLEELKACPCFLSDHGQFVALREVTTKRIADAGENKVFGLVVKKYNGGSLTSDEQSFIDSYVAARDALLAEHDAMKTAILNSLD